MWPTTDCLYMTGHAMEHSALLLFCVFGGNFMSSPELKQVWGSLHGSCITKRTETWIWQSQSCSVVFLVTLSKKKKSANMVSGKSSLTDYFNSIQSPSCDSNVGQLVPLFQVSFELRRRAEFFVFFLGTSPACVWCQLAWRIVIHIQLNSCTWWKTCKLSHIGDLWSTVEMFFIFKTCDISFTLHSWPDLGRRDVPVTRVETAFQHLYRCNNWIFWKREHDVIAFANVTPLDINI